MTNNEKMVVGFIGAGQMGKMHILNMLKYFPEVYVKTVVDPCVDAAWVADQNIPHSSTDIKAITEDKEIQAVVISAPALEQVRLIVKMAEAGKHIFCEKPVAQNLEDIQIALDAVENAGIHIQVGFNRRFDNELSAIKESVKNGDVGKIYMMKIVNRDPERPDLTFIPDSGGLHLDLTVHDFDMVRFISESEVDEVFAYGACLIEPEIEVVGDIDTSIISLKMKNGSLATIDNSRETNYGYDQQLEVFGSKGAVKAHNTSETTTVLSNAEGVFLDGPHWSFVKRYAGAYIRQFAEFFDCIKENRKPSVGIEDTRIAVALALAAKKSMAEKRSVKLEEILS